MRNKKLCVIISATIAAAISGAVFFMKRNRKKGGYAALMAAVVFSIFATSVTAYAKANPEDEYGNEPYYAETTITIPALPIEPAPEQPEPTPAPQTLTPPGNMTLVDDFSGESAADKQFITVVTRNGHFFYIVVDRSTDRFNVHFLNQVDEYDLWAILEDEAQPRPTPAPVEPMPEVDPVPEPEPADEQSGGIGRLLIMLVLVGAIGGGAYYYFKVMKPQQGAKTKGTTELDEFYFDEDEEDTDSGITTGDYSGTADSAIYNADEEMPDFTATDSEPGELPFELADFDEETPESGGE